ncbi:hypothetical protein [Nocardioides speluncae]|uniref:hypothetical protein n=1 Tax=Nocardioides speluncae TaxID=2670337 RepID=UPI000D692F95|nr:hypothetical protein [Nocardioides speluncae]
MASTRPRSERALLIALGGGAVLLAVLVAVTLVARSGTSDSDRRSTFAWMAVLLIIEIAVQVTMLAAFLRVRTNARPARQLGGIGFLVGVVVAVAALVVPRPGAYIGIQLLVCLLAAFLAPYALAISKTAEQIAKAPPERT